MRRRKPGLKACSLQLWRGLVVNAEIYYEDPNPATRVYLTPGEAGLIIALDDEIDVRKLYEDAKAARKQAKRQ